MNPTKHSAILKPVNQWIESMSNSWRFYLVM